ncbi:hypothetical protein NUH16_003199 [Penicillium rubens]|nr:hypothetical protein NUH16_003199 [Penicillium rubens]
MVKPNEQVFSHEGPPRKRGYEESSEHEHNASISSQKRVQYQGTGQYIRRPTDLDSEASAPTSSRSSVAHINPEMGHENMLLTIRK